MFCLFFFFFHNTIVINLCFIFFPNLFCREFFRLHRPFLDFFVSAKSIRDRRLLLLIPSDDSSIDVCYVFNKNKHLLLSQH